MKPRKDITLGEMQEECLRQKGYCDFCEVKSVCATHLHRAPDQIDLTDPPRFNEAQMAFWRGWYEIGARNVAWSDKEHMFMIQATPDVLTRQYGRITLGVGVELLGLSIGNSLDLAELLGKDGAE